MNESLTAVRSTDWSCVLSLQSFTLPVRCDSLMRECAVQFVMYFKCLFNMFGTFACYFLGCKVLAADNASKWMKGFSSGTILKESFDFVVLRKLFHSLQTSANQTQLSIPAHFHRRPIKYWVYYI